MEIEFSVTPEGTVALLKVTGSSHVGFEGAVLRAVSQWRYTPRVVGSRAVPREGVRVRVIFEILRA